MNPIDRVYYEEAMENIKYTLKSELEPARRHVQKHLEAVGLKVSGRKVVDFGCHNGINTFGLMWYLNAAECVGIDYLTSPGSDFNEIETWIERCSSFANFMQEDDRIWWEREVPNILKEKRFPGFIKKDIALV